MHGSRFSTRINDALMKMKTLGLLVVLSTNLCTIAPWCAETLEAPAFSIVGDGGTLNLADFRGKVIYLDFFASWCSPCRASFRWLNEVQEKNADKGLVVLAINVDKEKELAEQFLKEHPAKFRIGYDPEGTVAQAYQVKGMPSSYIIDRKGQIRVVHVGYRTRDNDKLEQDIQRLLTE